MEGNTIETKRPQFRQYIGIDFSGRKKPTTPLKYIQVFEAAKGAEPVSVRFYGRSS